MVAHSYNLRPLEVEAGGLPGVSGLPRTQTPTPFQLLETPNSQTMPHKRKKKAKTTKTLIRVSSNPQKHWLQQRVDYQEVSVSTENTGLLWGQILSGVIWIQITQQPAFLFFRGRLRNSSVFLMQQWVQINVPSKRKPSSRELRFPPTWMKLRLGFGKCFLLFLKQWPIFAIAKFPEPIKSQKLSQIPEAFCILIFLTTFQGSPRNF